MILLPSVLRDNVDDSRHRLAVLGIEGPAYNLKLLHGIVVDLDRLPSVVDIRHRYPIDPVCDLARSPSPDVDSASRIDRDPRLQRENLRDLGNGQRVDLLGIDPS